MSKIIDELLSNNENVMNQIVSHISNGGSLIDLAEVWDVRYSDLVNWIDADKNMLTRYTNAVAARDEWIKQRMLKELQTIAFSNTKKLFNDDGKFKNPKEWEDETGASIESISIVQKQGSDGSSEESFKIKNHSKLKAIELYGKHLKMFTDRVEVEGEFKLEDLLAGVKERANKT